MPFAFLVQASGASIGRHGKAGIGARSGMQHLQQRPGLAFIKTLLDGHVDPFFGVGRIAEQNPVACVSYACLADGFDKGMIKMLASPGDPTVIAVGHLPVRFGAVIIAHVQHQPPVVQFHHFTFIHLMFRCPAAQVPCCPVIIRVDDVGVIVLCFRFNMVAGNN